MWAVCVCVCDKEAVCVFCCAVKLHFHCFFLTPVVLFGYFSPCCHISLPLWKTLILSSGQQPCGVWDNIDLCCCWTPASLRERQDVVFCSSESQHKIKVEQSVKCNCGAASVHFQHTPLMWCLVGQLTRFKTFHLHTLYPPSPSSRFSFLIMFIHCTLSVHYSVIQCG